MTHPTAERIREILAQGPAIDREQMLHDLADELTTEGDPTTAADLVQAESYRRVDELALRALETVLDVEGLGRDASHLLDGHDEPERRVVHRDRIHVETLARALRSVDELGRHAHLIRKGLALGPLRDDPDARIRSLESVLRRVLVMVDAADARLRTAAETGDPEEVHEILWRTINLAAAAAPGTVSLHGPTARYREIPSVVELDEAARHLDTIATLRFPVPERTGPDPTEPELALRDDVRTTRRAAADALVALARLGANRPRGIRPGEWPSVWDRLDEVAALLTRAIDDAFSREADPPVELLDRARDLVAQAGGDPARWTPPGDAGDGSNDPE